MTLWGTEPVTQVQLREAVLIAHRESKTPEHVKKPHWRAHTHTHKITLLLLKLL